MLSLGVIGQTLHMSLTRKYHNHTLKTNPWHHDEEKQNINSINMTLKGNLSNATSSLCPSEMIAKLEITLKVLHNKTRAKHTNNGSNNKFMNQQ